MYILTVRTDKPEAELGLYQDEQQRGYQTWEAHRQLAETIHHTIQQLLEAHHVELQQLHGIVLFKGPGSFTGLRIGAAVANALADGCTIPIVGAMGDNWIQTGITALKNGENHKVVVPEYGALPNITAQKK